MNSIILIAACAVCLDQLFFRGRLASYVVDNLKGPKKKHTGHNAAPHTPNAGTAPRQGRTSRRKTGTCDLSAYRLSTTN